MKTYRMQVLPTAYPRQTYQESTQSGSLTNTMVRPHGPTNSTTYNKNMFASFQIFNLRIGRTTFCDRGNPTRVWSEAPARGFAAAPPPSLARARAHQHPLASLARGAARSAHGRPTNQELGFQRAGPEHILNLKTWNSEVRKESPKKINPIIINLITLGCKLKVCVGTFNASRTLAHNQCRTLQPRLTSLQWGVLLAWAKPSHG